MALCRARASRSHPRTSDSALRAVACWARPYATCRWSMGGSYRLLRETGARGGYVENVRHHYAAHVRRAAIKGHQTPRCALSLAGQDHAPHADGAWEAATGCYERLELEGGLWRMCDGTMPPRTCVAHGSLRAVGCWARPCTTCRWSMGGRCRLLRETGARGGLWRMCDSTMQRTCVAHGCGHQRTSDSALRAVACWARPCSTCRWSMGGRYRMLRETGARGGSVENARRHYAAHVRHAWLTARSLVLGETMHHMQMEHGRPIPAAARDRSSRGVCVLIRLIILINLI
jgi:hypothetical protein